MTLSAEVLKDVKQQLVFRREHMAQDLRKATEEMINDDVTYNDSVDQSAADTDRSLSVHIKNREREILAQIDQALRRIDAGAFGDCQQCGEAIAEARIKAFPFTTLCIDCKAELESEGQRIPGRA